MNTAGIALGLIDEPYCKRGAASDLQQGATGFIECTTQSPPQALARFGDSAARGEGR
jgi:hypothetical protein